MLTHSSFNSQNLIPEQFAAQKHFIGTEGRYIVKDRYSAVGQTWTCGNHNY